MAKGAYVGVSGTARKVKKIYIGVGGVARLVKKAYIGVGGVARPFWSSAAEVSYYGAITSLGTARKFLAATSLDDYALFGGGNTGANPNDYCDAVAAYDSSLVAYRNLDPLSYNSRASGYSDVGLTSTATTITENGVKAYALFTAFGYVDRYDDSFTKTSVSEGSTTTYMQSGASVGEYAVFAGGYRGSSVNLVLVYDSSLTRITGCAMLPYAPIWPAAASFGNYAIFAGGGIGSNNSGVVAYNASLIQSIPQDLDQERGEITATSVGNYVLLGGGYMINTSTMYDGVDTYDLSLTKTTSVSLSAKRYWHAATTLNNVALFGGGVVSKVVDAFDVSLTRTTPDKLSGERYGLAATTVGNYVLFGGGYGRTAHTSTVEAYTVT